MLAIEQQAKKLEFLVNALVKTSRLENGIIVTTPKLSKVDELVEVVNAQVIPKAKEKGISLTTKECGLEALFDPKWVAEALYNIADNAIKYTPDGGKVSIKIMEYQMFVRIDVIDTGIGMTEEEIPKIFARFYRSSNVCEQDGVGIGL